MGWRAGLIWLVSMGLIAAGTTDLWVLVPLLVAAVSATLLDCDS